jgi:tRNA-specific 2-thiouridylase
MMPDAVGFFQGHRQISMQDKRVILAMSGGVDSSVAAQLLVEQGYDITGVFMRHGADPTPTCVPSTPSAGLKVINNPSKQGCCSASDAEDARRVADALGIPFYALNLRDDFGRIMNYFVDEYAQGRTPNPCVMCNNILKFGKLFEYADNLNARYVATGHYAQLQSGDGISLRRGVDASKDQSYVLFGVQAAYLSRMLLPIGSYQKREIRQLAERFGLRVAGKPDSQEICFVAPGQHADFVAQRRTRDTRGELVTTGGEVVARHDGIENFTVGQRKGLGVAMGEPYFVVRIDASSNQVVIGRKNELNRNALTATGVNWLSSRRGTPFRCQAQIRYNSQAHAATAIPLPDGSLRVEFDQPRPGVAPGQAVVCYEADRVLVGGWIQDSE